jgi:probable rRNA maturation factor
MAVTVEIRTAVKGLDASRLERFAGNAQRAVGVRGGVAVVVTSNAEMKRMNDWFRGKKKPTDVLSFVADGIRGYAGDISISAEIAKGNAARLGHTLEEEVKVLVLHGLLHLAGYDHETDKGEMARKEQQLRTKLGLPATLIERSEPRASRVKAARAK